MQAQPPRNTRLRFAIALLIVFVILFILAIVGYIYGITHLHANIF